MTFIDLKEDLFGIILRVVLFFHTCFDSSVIGREWINIIKADRPRYIRHQLIIIKKTFTETEAELLNKIGNVSDFRSI